MDTSVSQKVITHLRKKYNDTQPNRTSRLLSQAYFLLNNEIQKAVGVTEQQVHHYYHQAKVSIFRSHYRLRREEGHVPYLTKERVAWLAQSNLACQLEKKLSAQGGKKLELDWKVVEWVDKPCNEIPEEKRNGKGPGGVWLESTEFMEWVEKEKMKKRRKRVARMEKVLLAAVRAGWDKTAMATKTADDSANSDKNASSSPASFSSGNAVPNHPIIPKRKVRPSTRGTRRSARIKTNYEVKGNKKTMPTTHKNSPPSSIKLPSLPKRETSTTKVSTSITPGRPSRRPTRISKANDEDKCSKKNMPTKGKNASCGMSIARAKGEYGGGGRDGIPGYRATYRAGYRAGQRAGYRGDENIMTGKAVPRCSGW